MSKASSARVRANDKYNRKAYDSIFIRAYKGTRERWQVSASALGLSLAGLIVAAVTEYLERHPVSASEDLQK